MSLLQMTLSGGAFILFITVVRALALHRLPKAAFLVLWEMAALRLLLPFSIPSPFSVLVPMERLPVVGEYLMAAEGSIPLGLAGAGMTSGASTSVSTAPGSVLPMVWLVGTLLMAAYFVVFYVRARQRFHASVPDDTPAVRRWLAGQKLRRPLEVRQSDQVLSPLTYGILCPVILLPKNMERGDEASLNYILTHEFIHIRRFDAIVKLVFAADLCVHWFNPLAWVMYVLANRDLEMSCDERVMDTLGGKEKASYALTLITMAETQSRCFSLYNHFSKLAIEERIEAIMKYKKASILAVALAVALVLGATTAFATSAADNIGVGHFITGEDGSQEPVSNSQVIVPARFSVGADGKCTPNPDPALQRIGIPESPIPQSSNGNRVDYYLTPEGQVGGDENNLVHQPSYTEEEMQQIIADIESGKIQPLEIPDDPNVTIGFMDYSGGNCVEKN